MVTFIFRRVPTKCPITKPVIENKKQVKAIMPTANQSTSGWGIKITPVANVSIDVAKANDNNPKKEKSAR